MSRRCNTPGPLCEALSKRRDTRCHIRRNPPVHGKNTLTLCVNTWHFMYRWPKKPTSRISPSPTHTWRGEKKCCSNTLLRPLLPFSSDTHNHLRHAFRLCPFFCWHILSLSFLSLPLCPLCVFDRGFGNSSVWPYSSCLWPRLACLTC